MNVGSERDASPSLTLMTIPLYVPTLLADGVPLSRPVLLLKLAHVGRFAIENVSGSPSASLADGVKEKDWSCVTVVVGVPLIDGGEFGGGALGGGSTGGVAVTVIANVGNDRVAWPSLTLMTIPLCVPTAPAEGVPLSRPVALLKVAQLGRPVIENVSPSPSPSLADGVNEYGCPC